MSRTTFGGATSLTSRRSATRRWASCTNPRLSGTNWSASWSLTLPSLTFSTKGTPLSGSRGALVGVLPGSLLSLIPVRAEAVLAYTRRRNTCPRFSRCLGTALKSRSWLRRRATGSSTLSLSTASALRLCMPTSRQALALRHQTWCVFRSSKLCFDCWASRSSFGPIGTPPVRIYSKRGGHNALVPMSVCQTCRILAVWEGASSTLRFAALWSDGCS